MKRMSYFLFKTEPDVYSFDDFLNDKETVWDGVTNPTAVKTSARDEGGDEVDFLPHRR
jgi:predicted RNA-binding protein with PUA-like domain